uniref:Lebercilin domain-containing protein n=1 Tax=Mesocestoides corti TaxID=53468 RepID=A0A5K3EL16_MESCO
MCEILHRNQGNMKESDRELDIYFNDSFESDDNVEEPEERSINNPTEPPKEHSAKQRSHRHDRKSSNNQHRPTRPSGVQQRRTRQSRKSAPKLKLGNPSEFGLEAWEISQNLIAQLRSENDQLKRELKNCRVELKTVERQCKVQSARLTKVVGREADMPGVIDRLTAEVRSLQIQLRRKHEQAETAEKKASEMEHRLLPLLDRREHKTTGSSVSGDQQMSGAASDEAGKHTQALESLQAILEEERQSHRELQRKMELMERCHRSEQGAANDQIRKLRKLSKTLQSQLDTVTQNLQEKTKLLELQNIYSQRLPKSALTHSSVPPTEGINSYNSDLGIHLDRNGVESRMPLAQFSAHVAPERCPCAERCSENHAEGALRRSYKDRRTDMTYSEELEGRCGREKHRQPRYGSNTISNMVAKIKDSKRSGLSSLFSRSCAAISTNTWGVSAKNKESPLNHSRKKKPMEVAKSTDPMTSGRTRDSAHKRQIILSKNAEIAASLGQPIPIPARRQCLAKISGGAAKQGASSPESDRDVSKMGPADSDDERLSDLQDCFNTQQKKDNPSSEIIFKHRQK